MKVSFRPIVATLLPVAACLLQRLGWPAIAPFAWFLFYPVVFLSSWLGGFGAGVASTFLSTGLAWWYFLEPVHALVKPRSGSYVSAVMFLGMGLLFSYFHHLLRRANRKAAQALEAEHQATFRQAAVGLGHMTLTGGWIQVNQRCCDILGYSREALLATSWEAIAHPDDLEADRSLVRRLVAGECPERVLETRFIHRSGSTGWLNLAVSLVRNAQGGPDYLILVVEDITQRKRAEEQLRASRANLDAALASMTDAVFISNAAGEFIEFNEAFATFHRFEGKADCARKLADYPDLLDVFLADGEPAPLELWAVPRALRGETATHAEYGLRRKDTGESWVGSYSFAPIRDKQGAIVGSVVVGRDITDLKRVEAELRRNQAKVSRNAEELERRVAERTAELEAANGEMESFAYAVSHDLRAPLRALDGFSQVLLEDCAESLTESGKGYLAEISAASHRMSGLIDGLLQLSRVTRDDMERVPVDLSALAGALLADLARTDPGPKAQWRIEPGIVVQGDPRLLLSAMGNLLGNAWKYSARVAAPSIEVGTVLEGGQSWVRVADNGCGFDMAHADKLFKPFQRLHRQDEFPGLGIGLATVHRIVQRHGGSLKAVSAPGQGAAFLMFLPNRPPMERT